MSPSTAPHIDHRALYRLPWSFSDNVLSWLEATWKCNLACDGCYRANVADSHKSLEQLSHELGCFEAQRTFDSVSIAGGEPLLHPDIVGLVRLVAKRGYKPTLNTNGIPLTDGVLRDLKDAGLKAITFHVDSKQGRPGWKDKTEIDLNALRLSYAERVAKVGGISCGFNSTVYEDTLDQVPDLVQFAQDHIDLVHVMVFITLRGALLDGEFDYFRGGQQINPEPLKYAVDEPRRRLDLTSREVVRRIRERFPDFSPSGYLGGTEKPDSLKWLLTGRLGTPGKIFGYVGPRFLEAGQVGHHALRGKYLGYISPALARRGKLMLGLAALDGGTRRLLQRYLGHVARHPSTALQPLHFQSIMVIQPIDILPDGRQNMCDGCPDMTIHDGEMVWSCRLDECLRFGGFVATAPKRAGEPDRVERRRAAGLAT